MKEPWITRDQAAGKSEQDLSALVDLEWVISIVVTDVLDEL